MNHVDRMMKKLNDMSTANLKVVWHNLGETNWSNQDEYAPGISMNDWAESVKAELDARGATCHDCGSPNCRGECCILCGSPGCLGDCEEHS